MVYPADSTGEPIRIQLTYDPRGPVVEATSAFLFWPHARLLCKGVDWDGHEIRNGDWLAAYNYQVHMGTVLRLPSRLLMLFGCLIVASLPVTGFLVWCGLTEEEQSAAAEPFQTLADAAKRRKEVSCPPRIARASGGASAG